MRAVVWTDAIQMIILLIGLAVIAALGTIKEGGGQAIWDLAKRTNQCKKT
jgi:Na+/proline symporter